MTRVFIRVGLDLPDGATRQDARYYVEDAVASMKGCLCPPGGRYPEDPGDPMFCLDGDKVTAVVIPRRRKTKRAVICR